MRIAKKWIRSAAAAALFGLAATANGVAPALAASATFVHGGGAGGGNVGGMSGGQPGGASGVQSGGLGGGQIPVNGGAAHRHPGGSAGANAAAMLGEGGFGGRDSDGHGRHHRHHHRHFVFGGPALFDNEYDEYSSCRPYWNGYAYVYPPGYPDNCPAPYDSTY